jgi:hypothetical protein
MEHNMLDNNHIIHDQRQVDMEDYIAGMMQAADIAEQHLHGQAAALIRGSATVLRHSEAAYRANMQASQKPVEAGLWCEPYKDDLYAMMDGRLAHRVYGALTNFSSLKDFFQATDHDFEQIPLLGEKTIKALIELQESWGND